MWQIEEIIKYNNNKKKDKNISFPSVRLLLQTMQIPQHVFAGRSERAQDWKRKFIEPERFKQ